MHEKQLRQQILCGYLCNKKAVKKKNEAQNVL